MKLIIIEGCDNVGKDTVINQLKERYNYCKVIHCEKPKSKELHEAAKEQCETFNELANDFINACKSNCHEVVIHNRSWYGEYVYGCMYRHNNDNYVKEMISDIENKLLSEVNQNDIYFITLLADNIDFLVRNDDGLSISEAKKDLIETERDRFKEIFNHSLFTNKKIIYVNKGMEFKSKEEIMKEILYLLNFRNC